MNSLHQIEGVRLTEEELIFLKLLARKISNEVYRIETKYITYDDSDRLHDILARAKPLPSQ